jgi:hypothetical protein
MCTAQFLENGPQPDFVTPKIAYDEPRDRKARDTALALLFVIIAERAKNPWNHQPLNPLGDRRVVGS